MAVTVVRNYPKIFLERAMTFSPDDIARIEARWAGDDPREKLDAYDALNDAAMAGLAFLKLPCLFQERTPQRCGLSSPARSNGE